MSPEPLPPYESPGLSPCEACPARLVCRCLQISEEVVIEAITVSGISTVRELRRCTGAGQGCTACLRRLQRLLQEHSQPLAKAS